jgi:hypothetical protein
MAKTNILPVSTPLNQTLTAIFGSNQTLANGANITLLFDTVWNSPDASLVLTPATGKIRLKKIGLYWINVYFEVGGTAWANTDNVAYQLSATTGNSYNFGHIYKPVADSHYEQCKLGTAYQCYTVDTDLSVYVSAFSLSASKTIYANNAAFQVIRLGDFTP